MFETNRKENHRAQRWPERWAIQQGACKNEFEARASWRKIVAALDGFSPENAHEVYAKFYQRQLEKLQPVAA